MITFHHLPTNPPPDPHIPKTPPCSLFIHLLIYHILHSRLGKFLLVLRKIVILFFINTHYYFWHTDWSQITWVQIPTLWWNTVTLYLVIPLCPIFLIKNSNQQYFLLNLKSLLTELPHMKHLGLSIFCMCILNTLIFITTHLTHYQFHSQIFF